MKGIPLDEIDFVLLDLDGTLLDKYFDDYFWSHLVPERYAERHDISFGRAKDMLFETYKRHEGTLRWTDLDYWSEELDLDIPALKEQLRHLIDIHPHVERFLDEMRRTGKRIHLLTNAHYKSVNLKFRETGIGRHFDGVLTSNELGHPKEDLAFWRKAREITGFDPGRSLFVDDTEDILRVARAFGVRYVVFKGRSSSQAEPRRSDEFPTITDFDELL